MNIELLAKARAYIRRFHKGDDIDEIKTDENGDLNAKLYSGCELHFFYGEEEGMSVKYLKTYSER